MTPRFFRLPAQRAWRAATGFVRQSGLALWGCVSSLLMPSLVWANESNSLVMIQPFQRGQVAEPISRHYARLLPQYLGEKATIHEASRGKYVDGVRAASATLSPNKSLLLMSPVLYGLLRDEEVAKRMETRWVPVQLILQRSWCLVSRRETAPKDGQSFSNWIKDLGRPVRIGVMIKDGLPGIWVRAMESKTGVSWQAQAFPASADDAAVALVAGKLDLMLEHCPEVERVLNGKDADNMRAKIRVLVSSSDQDQMGVPSFAQWRLPSISPGWYSWFVPASMKQEERRRLSQALYAITVREDTQNLIRDLKQEPSSLNTQDSKVFIEQSMSNWKSIANWLDGNAAAGSVPKKSAP